MMHGSDRRVGGTKNCNDNIYHFNNEFKKCRVCDQFETLMNRIVIVGMR